MTHLPAGLGSTDFHDLFVERSDSIALSWKGGRVTLARGLRSGTGVRLLGRSGTVRFRAVDDASPSGMATAVGSFARGGSDAPPSGSMPDRVGGGPGEASGLQDWDGEIRAVCDYIEEVARNASADSSRAGEIEIAAEAHLYRQEVHHETVDRKTDDSRKGVRIDLRLLGGGHSLLVRRLAAASQEALARRRPAKDVAAELCRTLAERNDTGVLGHPDGLLPVILGAGGGGPFLHEIGHLFEEDHLLAGREPFTDGERVASRAVSIVDDPAACEGRGSYHVDDAGARPSPCVLVAEGVVAGRLRSERFERTGRGDSPAGHARRASYRDLPLPRMACTFIAPGTETPDTIVRSTPRGLFVRTLRTGNVDPVSGRIVLVATEGFLIEAGRLTRPIAETLLIGSARTWLDAIDAVANDLEFDHGSGNCVKLDQQVPVTVGSPTIRIGVVRVLAP